MQEHAEQVVAQEHISARVIPFHSLHDAEYLESSGDHTKFFRSTDHFAHSTTSKVFVECNLNGMGGCIPEGMVKWVQWVSIQVEGASDEDEFDVSFYVCQGKFASFKCRSGTDKAARVKGSNKTTYAGIHDEKEFVREVEVEFESLRLLPREAFFVEVKAPEKFRGKYARVSLHGPIAVAKGS